MQKKKSSKALKVTKLEDGDRVVSWTSSAPNIVSVTANGKLKAKNKTGKAEITVFTKFGGTASCIITVQKNKVKLKSFAIVQKSRITLKKGKKITLAVNRNPITAEEKLSFASSSPKVASVTNKGVVRAKQKGKCKITVKSKNGKKKIIAVTVK